MRKEADRVSVLSSRGRGEPKQVHEHLSAGRENRDRVIAIIKKTYSTMHVVRDWKGTY